MRWSVLLGAMALGLGALVLLSRFGLFGPFQRPDSRPPTQSPAVEGPLLILASGTSLTARGNWTERLGEHLAACRGAPVLVEKVARAGATSRWGAPALRERLARLPRPDIVLIEYSINDAVLPRFVSLSASRENMLSMIEASRKAGAIPVLVTMTPAYGFERLERPFLPAYRAQYGELAQLTGAGLIETLAAWDAVPRAGRAQLVPDGVHPTEAAMEMLLVPSLMEGLQPLVCPPGAGRQ